MDTAAIQQALTPLAKLPLRHIGRAANLLWLHFGELRDVTTREGGSTTVGDWALHVQCAWRLCRHGGIVVAYRDYYYSPENEPLDVWDMPGKSRFDITARSLQMEFDANPPAVISIVVDDVGRLFAFIEPRLPARCFSGRQRPRRILRALATL